MAKGGRTALKEHVTALRGIRRDALLGRSPTNSRVSAGSASMEACRCTRNFDGAVLIDEIAAISDL